MPIIPSYPAPDGPLTGTESIAGYAGGKTRSISVESIARHTDDAIKPLLADGTRTPEADIPFGGKRLTGLGDARDPGDAMSKHLLGLASSVSGAALLAHLPAGAGGTTIRTVQDVLQRTFDVRDYLNSDGSPVIFDGRDNTTGILACIAAATAFSGAKRILFPPGDSFLSQTILFTAGMYPQGAGGLTTRFRRTGDYGDTFQFGTNYGGTIAYNSSGNIGGFMIYQDHGAGFFPPNVPASFINLATTGSHINMPDASKVTLYDMLISGLIHQIRLFGGLQVQLRQVDMIGVFDPANVSMQETQASILIDGNLSHIPTDIEFIGCRIGGPTSPQQTITWPGSFASTNVRNLGGYRGLDVQCCEGVRFFGGYIGAAAFHGVRLQAAAGSILSAFWLNGTFIDSNGAGNYPGYTHEGGAGLFIDSTAGGTATQITWAPSEHNCQQNSYRCISDENTSGPGFTQASVDGLNISGHYRVSVGSAIWLTHASRTIINANIHGWNSLNFYSAAPYDCGAYIGSGCKNVIVDGGMGGDSTDLTAVRFDQTSGNPSHVTVKAVAWGSTTLSGDLA